MSHQAEKRSRRSISMISFRKIKRIRTHGLRYPALLFSYLERVGFGATNWEYLFVNPREYASARAESVCRVSHARIPVSIYNIPLCMLPRICTASPHGAFLIGRTTTPKNATHVFSSQSAPDFSPALWTSTPSWYDPSSLNRNQTENLLRFLL
jgi:hypothetical protein